VERTVTLVAVSRSHVVESAHAGTLAVVAGDGEILAFAGNPDAPTYWRSAAKLHQSLAVVDAGAVKRWGITDAQLAIMCGSHNGEAAQVRSVAGNLERIGVDESALRCGAQTPHNERVAAELVCRNERPPW
jgi:L-asparaginase II